MKDSFRRLIGVLLGVASVGYALWAALYGEIAGFGHAGHSQWASRTEDPTYFWVSVLILFVAGILFIIGAAESPDARRRYLDADKPWVVKVKRKPRTKK